MMFRWTQCLKRLNLCEPIEVFRQKATRATWQAGKDSLRTDERFVQRPALEGVFQVSIFEGSSLSSSLREESSQLSNNCSLPDV